MLNVTVWCSCLQYSGSMVTPRQWGVFISLAVSQHALWASPRNQSVQKVQVPRPQVSYLPSGTRDPIRAASDSPPRKTPPTPQCYRTAGPPPPCPGSPLWCAAGLRTHTRAHARTISKKKKSFHLLLSIMRLINAESHFVLPRKPPPASLLTSLCTIT